MLRTMVLFVLFGSLVPLMTSGTENPGPNVVPLPGLPAFPTEPGWDFQSSSARKAKAKFDVARRQAEENFSRAVSTARKALAEDLEAAMKEATQLGNLDEALKLRAALESVRREEAAGGVPGYCPPYLPVGRWKVDFTNGVGEACEVRKEGTAFVSEPQRSAEAKVEAKDGTVLLVYRDDRVERWTPAGHGMIVEHWFPIARFPSVSPVLGYAQRVP